MNANLTSADLAMFTALGIPSGLIERACIERVPDQEARQKYGLTGYGDRSGLVYPYLDPLDGRRTTARLRRDNCEIEDGKPRNKYISPYGDHRHLYFVPGCTDLLRDSSVPIVLVEAEKSALALTAWAERTSRRILPVAMGGCWGWRGRIGKVVNKNGERVDETGPISDLRHCDGRKVYILLDSNASINPKVQQARAALVRQLHKQKATVTILELPTVGDVNGPDDYIAVQGDEAMANLLDGAEEGARVLDAVAAFIRRYVWMIEAQIIALVLWLVHTHAFEAARATPYIRIESPVPECGKTTLVELLDLLAARPWMTSGITKAVVIRKVEKEKCSLLLDEADKQFAGDKEMLAAIIGVLNSGYRASGRYSMAVPGKGGGWDVRDFSTFCPKVFSGLGNLPDTLRSRSIPIDLERMPSEARVEEPDEYITGPEAAKLKARMAEWAGRNMELLRASRPDIEGLGHRQREVVRPLLAIADAAGGEWGKKAREAFKKLFGTKSDDASVGERLLSDTRTIFNALKVDKLRSEDLVGKLAEIEISPWADWKHGKSITKTGIARLLKPFNIRPGSIRIGDDADHRGYERESFEDAWNRYLPPLPPPEAPKPPHPPQSSIHADPSHFSEPPHSPGVADAKSEENPIKMRIVAGVADGTPDMDGGGGSGAAVAAEPNPQAALQPDCQNKSGETSVAVLHPKPSTVEGEV